MKYYENKKDIVIENQDDFELSHIFDCGQCFRFNKNDDGSYTGTAFGKTVRILKNENRIVLKDISIFDFETVWRGFLDLDRDYTSIKKQLTLNDDTVMNEAVKYGAGIRILNQDLWETMISFIISASNNIPRIKKIIELLCHNFGDAHTYDGQVYYSFPSPEKISSLELDDLSVIRAGFRDKYILNCARNVVNGTIDLDAIKEMTTPCAKQSLLTIQGVGNKVSDCILLFGLSRFDSFPVDVWIKRIMEYFYFSGAEQTIPAISALAAEKYGSLGGIAQQYLFFYARENKIGV